MRDDGSPVTGSTTFIIDEDLVALIDVIRRSASRSPMPTRSEVARDLLSFGLAFVLDLGAGDADEIGSSIKPDG
jgi:hypothetical protein